MSAPTPYKTRTRNTNSIVNPSQLLKKIVEIPATATATATQRTRRSIDSNEYYNRATYNVGVSIYHGAKYAGPKHVGTVPVFFADQRHALVYAKKRNPQFVKKFTFKKQPTLFQLSYDNLDILKKDTRLTDEERATIDMYYVNDGKNKFIWPVGFLYEKDMVGSGENARNLYLNRRMINLICRLGFDGWVVAKNSVMKQKNLDMEHYKTVGNEQHSKDTQLDKFIESYKKETDPTEKKVMVRIMKEVLGVTNINDFLKTQYVRYKINPYEPEIVMCKWQHYLTDNYERHSV